MQWITMPMQTDHYGYYYNDKVLSSNHNNEPILCTTSMAFNQAAITWLSLFVHGVIVLFLLFCCQTTSVNKYWNLCWLQIISYPMMSSMHTNILVAIWLVLSEISTSLYEVEIERQYSRVINKKRRKNKNNVRISAKFDLYWMPQYLPDHCW